VNPARNARGPLLAGLLLLALGTVFGGRLIEALPGVSAHAQFALLLAATLLIGWALSGAPRHLPDVPRRELALVAALTAAGLVARLWEVSGSTPGLVDEVHFIDGINAVLGDANVPLLRHSSGYLPAALVFSYWQTIALELAGRSLESLRLVSAIVGTLMLPAVYLLARALFDRRSALAALLLLLAFPPHLFYSRIGFAQIGDALFGALALALMAQALRGGQRWAWAWGGVALGMTQYFYEGGRLLFPPLVLIWFVYLILAWGAHRIRPHLRGMGIALLAAVLVALPLYVTMAATGAPFSSRFDDANQVQGLTGELRRLDDMSAEELQQLTRQLATPFLSYVALPDVSGDFFGSDQPMVLPLLTPLLLLGLWHILWRPRAPAVVVAGALFAAAAGNLLVSVPLWYSRYVMVMSLLPVLMAAGLRYTLPLLWPHPRQPADPRWRKLGASLVPLVAAAAALDQITYFFGPFREAYAVSFRATQPFRDYNDAVLRAVELPNAAQLQPVFTDYEVQGPHLVHTLMGFLLDAEYPAMMLSRDQLTPDFMLTLPRDRGYVFFVEATDAQSMRLLASAFPVGPPGYSTRPLLPAHEQYLMFVVDRPDGLAAP
jgi:hypothetical protein